VNKIKRKMAEGYKTMTKENLSLAEQSMPLIIKMCPKINDCFKIKMILDKDMLDFQYATCIREVCEICIERKENK
jgi:hypothetical protein